ncbi:carbohydrate kinase family protein [Methanobrevibacter sp. DSM 116169]|uniref:carbohydrate kinase family protein n=1 Tax=Methanobrevibacter sp. DSM 116169 TaxID=3242727 RepID=UPI0038FC9461
MEFLSNEVNVDVIGFGALNLDKFYFVDKIADHDEESFIKSKKNSPGGSAANTIIGLSRLGLKTSFIGKIAEDDDGEVIELNLAYNEVFSNNLIYSETGSTGKVFDFVDTEGERALYVDPGVNDDIIIDEINMDNVNATKIMHFSSFVGDSFKAQNDLIDKLNDDIILSFDPGMIYARRGINELMKILKRTNILLTNETEFRLFYEEYYREKANVEDNDSITISDMARHILKLGIDTVVVKKGIDGVFALNKNDVSNVKSFKVKPIDTTGAGDSFNSGFLYSYIKGFSLSKSCIIGNWVASKSVQSVGMEGFPSLDELKEFETEIN